ncbi:unnamed protein product [Allacma fusca]|uniref:Uncharacterized protein n=1 Tax=Allacma fusca TaxID=39272 RepID=A0A8J2NVX5_9HEXA|nr:unnamed protein product [Allacma fusca]
MCFGGGDCIIYALLLIVTFDHIQIDFLAGDIQDVFTNKGVALLIKCSKFQLSGLGESRIVSGSYKWKKTPDSSEFQFRYACMERRTMRGCQYCTARIWKHLLKIIRSDDELLE